MQVGGKLGIFTYHTSDVFTHYLKVNLMSQEPRLSRQESEMDEFEGEEEEGLDGEAGPEEAEAGGPSSFLVRIWILLDLAGSGLGSRSRSRTWIYTCVAERDAGDIALAFPPCLLAP